MSYCGMFLLPVPRARLEEYRDVADRWNAIFLEAGGVEHREWVMSDPVADPDLLPCPSKAGPDEVLVFAVVECVDKAAYQRIMAALLEDERVKAMDMGWVDVKRMHASGFSSLAGRRAGPVSG